MLGAEFDCGRPKVVALEVVEPFALLAIHACRTNQFHKVPGWLAGGQRGCDGSGHDIINQTRERWFDRGKLHAYYESQRDQRKQNG